MDQNSCDMRRCSRDAAGAGLVEGIVGGLEEGSNAGRPQLHFSTSSFDPQLMMVGYKCYQEYDEALLMVDDRDDDDELALLVIRWLATGTCV